MSKPQYAFPQKYFVFKDKTLTDPMGRNLTVVMGKVKPDPSTDPNIEEPAAFFDTVNKTIEFLNDGEWV